MGNHAWRIDGGERIKHRFRASDSEVGLHRHIFNKPKRYSRGPGLPGREH